MFTGIIQARGTIVKAQKNSDSLSLTIEAPGYVDAMALGDSLASNGCCLTIESKTGSQVSLTAINETLEITDLGRFQVGDQINLEKAATLQTALGGHLVSGHVDGCAVVREIIPMDAGQEVWLELPAHWMKYTIPKGSIALDGISLTIAEKKENQIRIALIPETLERTSAGEWAPGVKVHFEVDQVAKFVENFVVPKGV